MKKLSLGKLKLASEEVLQRSQLASIYGGSESGEFNCRKWSCNYEEECDSHCTCDKPDPNKSGVCVDKI